MAKQVTWVFDHRKEGNDMFTPEDREKAKEARRARPSRRDKMTAYTGTFAAQRKRFPRIALPMIDQAEKGSLPAAIKLMCLDCCAWEKREVRDCVIHWCPLYPHRPYQRIGGRNPNDPPEGQVH